MAVKFSIQKTGSGKTSHSRVVGYDHHGLAIAPMVFRGINSDNHVDVFGNKASHDREVFHDGGSTGTHAQAVASAKRFIQAAYDRQNPVVKADDDSPYYFKRHYVVSGKSDMDHGHSRDFLAATRDEAGLSDSDTHDHGDPIIEDGDGVWSELPGLAGHPLESDNPEDAIKEAHGSFGYGDGEPFAVYQGEHIRRLPFGDGDVFKPHKLIFSQHPDDQQYVTKHLNITKAIDHTTNPNFQKWFEGSKVVDEHGKPKVMYHGTQHEFSAFDPNHGIHFVGSADVASKWIGNEHGNAGEHIKPLFVSAKNIFDMENKEHRRNLQNHLEKRGSFSDNWGERKYSELIPKEHSVPAGGWRQFSMVEHPEVLKSIKALGHDAVYVSGDGGGDNIGVFHPHQLKSAIGNNGNFDTNNPDILKAMYPGVIALIGKAHDVSEEPRGPDGRWINAAARKFMEAMDDSDYEHYGVRAQPNKSAIGSTLKPSYDIPDGVRGRRLGGTSVINIDLMRSGGSRTDETDMKAISRSLSILQKLHPHKHIHLVGSDDHVRDDDRDIDEGELLLKNPKVLSHVIYGGGDTSDPELSKSIYTGVIALIGKAVDSKDKSTQAMDFDAPEEEREDNRYRMTIRPFGSFNVPNGHKLLNVEPGNGGADYNHGYFTTDKPLPPEHIRQMSLVHEPKKESVIYDGQRKLDQHSGHRFTAHARPLDYEGQHQVYDYSTNFDPDHYDLGDYPVHKKSDIINHHWKHFIPDTKQNRDAYGSDWDKDIRDDLEKAVDPKDKNTQPMDFDTEPNSATRKTGFTQQSLHDNGDLVPKRRDGWKFLRPESSNPEYTAVHHSQRYAVHGHAKSAEIMTRQKGEGDVAHGWMPAAHSPFSGEWHEVQDEVERRHAWHEKNKIKPFNIHEAGKSSDDWVPAEQQYGTATVKHIDSDSGAGRVQVHFGGQVHPDVVKHLKSNGFKRVPNKPVWHAPLDGMRADIAAHMAADMHERMSGQLEKAVDPTNGDLIRDEQGNPKSFYQGINPANRKHSDASTRLSNKAHWFTDNEKLATMYANGRSSMANPYILYPGGVKVHAHVTMSNPHIVDMAKKNLSKDEHSWTHNGRTEIGFRKERELKYARDNGHDGVLFHNALDGHDIHGGTIAAVFDPGQIHEIERLTKAIDPRDKSTVAMDFNAPPENVDIPKYEGATVHADRKPGGNVNIKFDGRPQEHVLAHLKNNKFRYNPDDQSWNHLHDNVSESAAHEAARLHQQDRHDVQHGLTEQIGHSQWKHRGISIVKLHGQGSHKQFQVNGFEPDWRPLMYDERVWDHTFKSQRGAKDWIDQVHNEATKGGHKALLDRSKVKVQGEHFVAAQSEVHKSFAVSDRFKNLSLVIVGRIAA